MEIVRLIDSALSVRIQIAPPFFVSEFTGAADETGQAALIEWTARMTEEPEPVVVIDMGALDGLSGPAASTLTRGLREAHRLDKGVRLVRCSQSDFDRLRSAGLRGLVRHCGSLAQATDGAMGQSEATTRLHIRAEPEMLTRLGAMLGGLGNTLQLPTERTEALRAAVLEAASNSIRHGSPNGARDRVTLFFHRLPGQLVVEVQDSGCGLTSRPEGAGITLMRHLMDEVEFLPNPEGLLTRLSMRVPARLEWS
jgi:anti-sigma regulatory factor (Ser/Thr protein kinase)